VNRQLLQLNNSGLGCLLTFLLMALLLSSIGLGWVVNGFLIFIAFLLLTPALAWFGLNWWLKRNLVVQPCPVCGYEFTGFNNTQCQCPNCEEVLKVEGGEFKRLTPPGTIDVDVVQ